MISKRERCGDCHALEGENRELGCDLERCPFCGGQLISCDCCYEILHIDSANHLRGLTSKQRMQWERTLNDKGRVPFIMYPNMCAKCGKLCKIPFEPGAIFHALASQALYIFGGLSVQCWASSANIEQINGPV